MTNDTKAPGLIYLLEEETDEFRDTYPVDGSICFMLYDLHLSLVAARIEELEDKLAKAVEAFIVYEKALREFATSTNITADEAEDFLDRDGGKLARSILALIEKEQTND